MKPEAGLGFQITLEALTSLRPFADLYETLIQSPSCVTHKDRNTETPCTEAAIAKGWL